MHLSMRAAFWGVLALLCACGRPSPTQVSDSADTSGQAYTRESTTVGDITIVVDESLQPLVEAEIDNFEFLYENASITPIYLPGEEAISTLLEEDSLRLVVAARELNYEEKKYLETQKTKAKYSMIATDAICLIINRENMDSAVSHTDLPKIFSGEINRWDQLNPNSSLGPINLVFDHQESSTVQYVIDSLLQGKSLREDVTAGKSNPEVLEYVGNTPNALGIIGVSWISDQDDQRAKGFRKSIRVMALEVDSTCSFVEAYGERFFQPYQGVVKEKCYPLSRGIFAILREPRIGLGTGFVAHLASDAGQRVILKAGMVPERAITRMVKFPDSE